MYVHIRACANIRAASAPCTGERTHCGKEARKGEGARTCPEGAGGPAGKRGECVWHLHANTRIWAYIRAYTNKRAASSPRQARRVGLALRQTMRFPMSISAPSPWTSCRFLLVYLIFIIVFIFCCVSAEIPNEYLRRITMHIMQVLISLSRARACALSAGLDSLCCS